MLFLTFQMGTDRYAIDASRVVEVLPLVGLKQIPRAPLGVAGLFNCRGVLVPVIDLSLLALGRPAEPCLSTRIVLVGSREEQEAGRLLGLIAERATATLKRDPADFVDPGVTSPQARYLGRVARDERGLVQWIETNHLLSDAVREALGQSADASPWPLPTSKPC